MESYMLLAPGPNDANTPNVSLPLELISNILDKTFLSVLLSKYTPQHPINNVILTCKGWYDYIMKMSSQYITEYFPFLLPRINENSSALQLFMKASYFCSQYFQSLPTEIIMSALKGNISDIPEIKKISKLDLYHLYAISIMNEHPIPEEIDNYGKIIIYACAFDMAAHSSNIPMLQKLIQEVDFHFLHITILNIARAGINLESMAWLICNVNSNIQDDVLNIVAENGHLSMMQCIHTKMHNGIDYDTAQRVIKIAHKNGHYDMVEWLFNLMYNSTYDHNLLNAVESNDLVVVEWLFDNVELSNEIKSEALILAVKCGHPEMMKLLSQKSTEISEYDISEALVTVNSTEMLIEEQLECKQQCLVYAYSELNHVSPSADKEDDENKFNHQSPGNCRLM